MNSTNKSFKTGRQGGFTLIELVLVIVILGILSATALPKFANLGGDARAASLKAARGAMISAAAMAHAHALLAPGAKAVTMEGVQVSLTNGYPASGDDAQARKFAELAGLSDKDYTFETDKGELKVSPKGVSGTNAGKCFVTYKPPVSAGGAPTFTNAATNFNCN